MARTTNYHTLTGCAATALAQVMNFWEWPQIGSGYHSYPTNWYGTQSANFGATYYDWNNMPNKLNSSSSSTQINAVATLMYHCGVSMDMDYGFNISGIRDASQVVNAVINNFRYSTSTRAIHKSDYSEANWISTLKCQLDASKPMVYLGYGTGGGHAFVCDGYDSRDYFHFNWGWSGDKDGFYPVTDLAPGPNGYGSGTDGDFTSKQWAIVDMVPRTTSANVANLQVNSNWYLSSDSIQYGGTIAASISVKNYGNSSFVGDVISMILDKDGNYFADYTIQTNCTIPKNGTLTLNPYVSGNAGLVPGSYYVALFYRNDDIGYQIVGSEYFANLASFKVYCQAEIETFSDFSIYSDDNHALVNGKQAQISVTLKNTGATYFHGKAALVLYNRDLSQGEDFDEIDMGIAGISAGGTRTLTFTGTSQLDPGTYILALVYSDNNNNVHFAGSIYYSNPVYIIVKSDEKEDTGEPTEEFELKPGNYVIVANRYKDGDRNWYYMTSDLGTASTKRFQAVSTGTESIEAINITDLEDKYVWTLEKSGIEWKLKNGAKYVSWTSGNSATLATTARNLTLDAENNQVQVHFNDGTSERYLSLNAAVNNNYFAFYGNQNQITKLFFIPYKESETPVTPAECKTVPYTETFASSQGDFTIENPELPSGFTSIWNWNSQYGMVANSTKNNAKYKSEAWLLSPCIELPENDKCVLTFSHAAKFFSSTEQMTLYLTTNYIEDAPGESEWQQLTIPNYPTGANWNWFESGEIDLSAYQGQEVVIAFRYVSDTNYAPQWEIKNFSVKQATTTDISNTKAEELSATKILRNGQILILRGDKTYTLQGQEVK